MKKSLFIVLLLAVITFASFAWGENAEWDKAPVITVAYEMSAEKLYLEWEGNALLYQVQMDGKKVMDVGQPKAIISIKKGTHTILIYPTNSDKADKNIISASIEGLGNFGLDLSSLGIGGQDLTFGNASEPLHIDYNPNPILNAVPDKLSASTVEDDNVKLSFVDRYNSDEYLITVRSGNDNNYVKFNTIDNSAGFITRDKAFANVLLDEEYLSSQNCMIPELDEKYSFQVQLRKYAVNLVNNEKILTVLLESKTSNWFDYTPTAGWTTAPTITFSSQIADGQVRIAWEHEDFGTGVEYSIAKINKALFVKTGEEIMGETSEHEIVLNDLSNGGYTFTVTPKYQGKNGTSSEETSVEVKNEWVSAPNISCEKVTDYQVRLSWTAPENIEEYHIVIYKGDSNSVLRFVNMDYKKVSEQNIDAIPGQMEYIYSSEKPSEEEATVRLKFEIYGIRHTNSGAEQKSSTSSAAIELE